MQASVLGMGCSPLGHSYGEADAQTAIETVREAYVAGINWFDVSPFYGSGRAEKVSRFAGLEGVSAMSAAGPCCCDECVPTGASR